MNNKVNVYGESYFLNNDSQKIEKIFNYLKENLRSYITSIVGNEYLVDDILQESILSLLKNKKNYNKSFGEFKSYLFIIIRNTSLREKIRIDKEKKLKAEYFYSLKYSKKSNSKFDKYSY